MYFYLGLCFIDFVVVCEVVKYCDVEIEFYYCVVIIVIVGLIGLVIDVVVCG